MSPKLQLWNLRTVTFPNDLLQKSLDRKSYIITASGYEVRSTEFSRQLIAGCSTAKRMPWLVIGFTDSSNVLARPQNDAFYKSHGFEINNFSSLDTVSPLRLVTETVKTFIRDSDGKPISIHIDYSCMPRLWYTRLPALIESLLRPADSVTFWYAEGNYVDLILPTAGVEDFSICSGRPTLSPHSRTHIMGLGLDVARSLSIYRVTDPENIVAFYAKSSSVQDHQEQILRIHRDIIAVCDLHVGLPISDFHASFSTLCSLAQQYREFGDVIFVPDGPKPLILASSLVPQVIGERGVISFYVNRRRQGEIIPLDVQSAGPIYGFAFDGH